MSATSRNGLGNFKSAAHLQTSDSKKVDFSPYANNQGSASALEKERITDPAMVRRLNMMQMHRSLDPAKIEPNVATTIDKKQKAQENTIMTMLSNNAKYRNQKN